LRGINTNDSRQYGIVPFNKKKISSSSGKHSCLLDLGRNSYEMVVVAISALYDGVSAAAYVAKTHLRM